MALRGEKLRSWLVLYQLHAAAFFAAEQQLQFLEVILIRRFVLPLFHEESIERTKAAFEFLADAVEAPLGDFPAGYHARIAQAF